MATFVDIKDRDSAEPRIRVIVAPPGAATALAADLERAGYRKADPEKVFGRRDWLVSDAKDIGWMSREFTFVPEAKVPVDAQLKALLVNYTSLEFAKMAEGSDRDPGRAAPPLAGGKPT